MNQVLKEMKPGNVYLVLLKTGECLMGVYSCFEGVHSIGGNLCSFTPDNFRVDEVEDFVDLGIIGPFEGEYAWRGRAGLPMDFVAGGRRKTIVFIKPQP